MAIISITITESELENVAGIPNSITLTTNIPATIFFTLDGTDPTTASSVVTGPIKLPTNMGSITLKAFATDGVDTSAIIEQTFGPDLVSARHPHDKVSGLNELTNVATFPFGSQDQGGPPIFGNTAGTTVDSPDIAGIPDGFDGTGTGTPSNETDKPLDEFDLIFSETNAIGQRGTGIGTLPADAKLVIPDPVLPLSVAEGSPNTSSPVFNPKSLVIFQDASEEPFDPGVAQVMRPSFSLEDPGTARYGSLLFTSGFEGNVPRGSALKSQFNPKDNTYTFYYRDADTNRWIISKVPYTPKPDVANFSKIVFGRERGVGRVFEWRPFRYRTLW